MVIYTKEQQERAPGVCSHGACWEADANPGKKQEGLKWGQGQSATFSWEPVLTTQSVWAQSPHPWAGDSNPCLKWWRLRLYKLSHALCLTVHPARASGHDSRVTMWQWWPRASSNQLTSQCYHLFPILYSVASWVTQSQSQQKYLYHGKGQMLIFWALFAPENWMLNHDQCTSSNLWGKYNKSQMWVWSKRESLGLQAWADWGYASCCPTLL